MERLRTLRPLASLSFSYRFSCVALLLTLGLSVVPTAEAGLLFWKKKAAVAETAETPEQAVEPYLPSTPSAEEQWERCQSERQRMVRLNSLWAPIDFLASPYKAWALKKYTTCLTAVKVQNQAYLQSIPTSADAGASKTKLKPEKPVLDKITPQVQPVFVGPDTETPEVMAP